MSEHSVYWFVAFHDDGRAKAMSPDQHRVDALSMVSGWKHGIEECIDCTPASSISRSRFYDRWPLPLGPRLSQGYITLAGDALHPMTPNLGQGGCCALEDAIRLAQCLKGVWGSTNELGHALQAYEQSCARRCLPLAVRSKGMGVILQSGWSPVIAARDTVISRLLDPGHFFDHTLFDVGKL